MENIKQHDPSYSPSERFEVTDIPDCKTCCDTGTVYTDSGVEEFCECASGQAAMDAYDSRNLQHEGYEMSDVEADADTLASCGWGTDEDYGHYEYDGDMETF